MDSFEQCSPSDFIVTARPNCSLTHKGRLIILSAVGFVSLGIACGFAVVGAWLVLPFAGLEVLLLGWAFHIMNRSAGDYECITVSGDRMRVERCQSRQIVRSEFQCYWAQLIMQSVACGSDCKLFVRSHGKQIEVGQYMNNEQRIELARELKKHFSRR